jgi:hypothetical protein
MIHWRACKVHPNDAVYIELRFREVSSLRYDNATADTKHDIKQDAGEALMYHSRISFVVSAIPQKGHTRSRDEDPKSFVF